MNTQKIEKFLNKVSEKGIAWTHNQGFEWFQNELLPTLEKADKIFADKNELLSDCWYVVGDVYDFNEAPLKAIEAYQKSLFYDSQNAAAYREIANMQESLGLYVEALQNINKSLEINPTEEYAINDRENILSSLQEQSKPLYEFGDSIWEMNEYLANQEFEKIIENPNKTPDIETLKISARAFGALNKGEEYLQIWHEIASKDKKFALNYSDWFFMPSKIYETKDIWQIFKESSLNIESSVFISFETLNKFYSKSLSFEEKRDVVCDYNIFTSENNIDELKKLKKKFPKWKELKKY